MPCRKKPPLRRLYFDEMRYGACPVIEVFHDFAVSEPVPHEPPHPEHPQPHPQPPLREVNFFHWLRTIAANTANTTPERSMVARLAVMNCMIFSKYLPALRRAGFFYYAAGTA